MTNLSKQYAKSLKLEKQVLEDLYLVNTSLKNGLERVLSNPKIKPQISEIIDEVLGKDVSPDVVNLLKLLSHKRELRLMPKIIAEYSRLLVDQKKAISGEIITAKALSPEELAEIQAKIETKINMPVSLKSVVSPGILGGAIIKIGSDEVDNSLRSRLKALV